MLFAVLCRDRPGALSIRKENRASHLAYVEQSGVVRVGGPFLDSEGEMCGSLVILDVPDRAAAEAWADGDPYATAGLFETVEIVAWKQVIG